MNLTTLYDLHDFDAFFLDILSVHLSEVFFIYHEDDVVDFRKEFLDKAFIPLFKSFRHDCVVGIVEDLLCHSKSFVK